jgi:hypothetical protein
VALGGMTRIRSPEEPSSAMHIPSFHASRLRIIGMAAALGATSCGASSPSGFGGSPDAGSTSTPPPGGSTGQPTTGGMDAGVSTSNGDAGASTAKGDAGASTTTSDAGTSTGSCTPACGTKTCGDDGCGGTCGACGFTQLCGSAGTCATPSTSGFVVDASSQLTKISSAIYGMGFANAQSMTLASLGRWGGDESSLYNWQLDVFNGSTWSQFWPPTDAEFQNSAGCIVDYAGRPSGTTCGDYYVQYNKGIGADTLMTVPAIGWVAKDGTSVGDPTGKTPTKNAVASSGAMMTSWVQHLASKFGTAANGGVKYYQLDNEPDNWKNSQTDVHPAAANHTELWTQTQTYAAAIKAGDPSAQVLAMCTMDPTDLVELNYVETGTFSDPAFAGHTSSPQYSLAAWMLQQAAAYEAQNGERIVDCIDTHYPIETSSGAAEVESTRSLWDPTFDTAFYFGQAEQLFPRMQQWINQNYPGTGICVSEYFMNNDGTGGGTTDPLSGVLQAETLGLYGKYGLKAAAYWNGVTDPNGGHLPVYNAFAMYRNYDGAGHTFGNYEVGAVSPMQDVTIFASSDSPTAPTTLWIMLINKMTSTQQVTVQLANFAAGTTAKVYQAAQAGAPAALADAPVSSGSVQVSLPQYSMTMVVVPKG